MNTLRKSNLQKYQRIKTILSRHNEIWEEEHGKVLTGPKTASERVTAYKAIKCQLAADLATKITQYKIEQDVLFWRMCHGGYTGGTDPQDGHSGPMRRYSRFDSSLIQTKLMEGADPNVVFNRINDTEAKDQDGCTALIYASVAGDVETVKLLLAAGAGTPDGDAALIGASETGHTGIVEVWQNSLGLRPLHLVFLGGQGRAFKRHQLRAIRSLLTYGADVHATMHNGNTPLHLAYQFSKTDPNPHPDHNASCGCPIGVLLSWGADTMALNSYGETPEACYKSDQ